MENLELRNSTIGLMASHPSFKRPALCKIWYYDTTDDKILMRVESAVNGEIVKSVSAQTITLEEYENRPVNSYNEAIEARWAFSKMGLSI